GGGHPGGGHPGGSVAHYSGGHGHYLAHVSSHGSHWTGGPHYSTRHNGHTHTTRHPRPTKVSKSKTNLSKSNVTDHSWKNASQEKNLNSRVTPLKTNPKNFKERRDLANKTALNSFWHQSWNQNWWHHHHNFFHIGWIGPWFWPFGFGN